MHVGNARAYLIHHAEMSKNITVLSEACFEPILLYGRLIAETPLAKQRVPLQAADGVRALIS